jgi:S-layer homology domain
MSFSDVGTSDWFYLPVDYLYCKGVISGYADGTFRPNNPTTRGQMAKIAMGAFPFPGNTEGGPHFADVSIDNAFYSYIETAYHYNIIDGYTCGGPGEPCDSQNRPYFRPSTQVTRSQLTKIIVLTASIGNPNVWQLLNPATPTFADVAPGSTFYTYVETAVAHTILSGYLCGGPGEPCTATNQPYFRLNRNATRAQLSKIIYGAVTTH